jgi:hypothetical protein
MMSMSLDEIGIKYGTDKSTVHDHPHGYTVHYDRAFHHLRGEPIKLLEIGVGGGESIRMWLEYFPNAGVVGVDTAHGTNPWDTYPGSEANPRYSFVQGDQASQEFWTEFLVTHGSNWDIIIDDGGHYANQVITTHNCLWQHLKSGCFYCIEDLNVSYPDLWGKYGDCFVPPPWPSHMDFIKGKLDQINREDEIESIYFSQQLAILKKK